MRYSSKLSPLVIIGLGSLVFNDTFNNNITVISWQSVLLMEEIGVPGENN
jgi:hypothetical protein